jgi:hypothetical protein
MSKITVTGTNEIVDGLRATVVPADADTVDFRFNIPGGYRDLVIITNGTKEIHNHSICAGISVFRIVDKDTGDILFETNDLEGTWGETTCTVLDKFCSDFNGNPQKFFSEFKDKEYSGMSMYYWVNKFYSTDSLIPEGVKLIAQKHIERNPAGSADAMIKILKGKCIIIPLECISEFFVENHETLSQKQIDDCYQLMSAIRGGKKTAKEFSAYVSAEAKK